MVTEGDTSPTGIAQEEQGTEGTAPQEGPHWDASLLEELAKPFGDGVVIGVDFSTGQAGAVLWGDSKQQFQTLEVAAQMILETLQQMQPQVVVPERKLIVAP